MAGFSFGRREVRVNEFGTAKCPPLLGSGAPIGEFGTPPAEFGTEFGMPEFTTGEIVSIRKEAS